MKISDGTVHKIPQDLKKALKSNSKSLEAWEDITPIARNEFICWVEYPKKQETRDEHVKRTITDLKKGKRRPCCWIGCIHRKDKKVSRSVQWILNKKSKQTWKL